MADAAAAATPAAGATPDSDGKEKGTDSKRSNRRHRQRINAKARKDGSTIAAHIPKEKFMGRSDDLQGFIYDVTTSKGGVAYTRTTEEIARHVGENTHDDRFIFENRHHDSHRASTNKATGTDWSWKPTRHLQD